MSKKPQNNKDKFNPMKNIGGNIVIWILIIGMSITALQIFSSNNNTKSFLSSAYSTQAVLN